MPRDQSWGRLPRTTPAAAVRRIQWRDDLDALDLGSSTALAYGLGRSYGDSCLNDGGLLLDTRGLNRVIAFDAERGILRAEAGASLDELLALIVPHGWFLPVCPGTRFVTLGGAVANDIHGKNHHRAGSFGCHVRRFELWRSDRSRRECAPGENGELFRATIGGLGLTGLMTWVEIQLARIPGPTLLVERIRFRSFDEYLALEAESSAAFELTVAWIDTLRTGPLRGVFQRASFASPSDASRAGTIASATSATRAPGDSKQPRERAAPHSVRVPIDLPSWAVNAYGVELFNRVVFQLQRGDRCTRAEHYERFFFPLDRVVDWNRLYGKRGFFQYQCVVPSDAAGAAREILERVGASRQGAFLAVLKKFGAIASPGLLSFPREGFTLALDFANRGARTLALLDALDGVVAHAGGCVYPAKDARMSAASFERYFPQWKEFTRYIDPRFSSSFWRRVTKGAAA